MIAGAGGSSIAAVGGTGGIRVHADRRSRSGRHPSDPYRGRRLELSSMTLRWVCSAGSTPAPGPSSKVSQRASAARPGRWRPTSGVSDRTIPPAQMGTRWADRLAHVVFIRFSLPRVAMATMLASVVTLGLAGSMITTVYAAPVHYRARMGRGSRSTRPCTARTRVGSRGTAGRTRTRCGSPRTKPLQHA